MSGQANTLHLKIITPAKIISDDYVESVTVPSAEGEITILPSHANLFSMLKEGVLKIQKKSEEDYLAIGGGFLETDGIELNILVSRAYRQDEVDEKMTQEAVEDAKKLVAQAKDEIAMNEAKTLLRRSLVDMKLIKKHKKPSRV